MKSIIHPWLIIIWKDILLEFRAKDITISVLVFGVLLAIVFNFALNINPQQISEIAAGIIWVSFAFSGILIMSRTFVREQEQGGLEGLLLSPISRDVIFLSKVLVSFLFMIAIEAILLPVFATMLNINSFSWILIITVVLATLGFATVGTLFSFMAVKTRSREIMLPVLFFPIILPVILGAIEASKGSFGIGYEPSWNRWLPLIAIFDALFLVICPWIFSYLVEE